jgi:hypothetical protein
MLGCDSLIRFRVHNTTRGNENVHIGSFVQAADRYAPGYGSVSKLVVADVDTYMRDRPAVGLEEHEVSWAKVALGDFLSLSRLRLGASLKLDAEFPVHVLREAGAIEAVRRRSTIGVTSTDHLTDLGFQLGIREYASHLDKQERNQGKKNNGQLPQSW